MQILLIRSGRLAARAQPGQKTVNALSEDGVLYLIDAFDNLVNGNDKLKKQLSPDYEFYYDEEKSFKNALKHDFKSNQERVMFHAYVRFLIQNKGNNSGIDQWMRVIHNLAYNTIIDGADEMARTIKSIENMLPYSNNILNYLVNKDVDSFASWQILEEKVKAHLILKSVDWKNIIEKTEKHDYFDGQIGFILEFAGIVDYYKTNKNYAWSNDKQYLNKFKNYSDKSVAVFGLSENDNEKYIRERAILSKGDYLLKASSDRKNLLTTKSNLRDYSWKRLLRIGDNIDKKNFVKQVLNEINFPDVQESLTNIIKNYKNKDWRFYFISNPDLINMCEQGFIKFINENDIILLAQSQMNHYHAEMYTYYLWKELLDPKIFEYYWSKSYDEVNCIYMKFCHNKINYEIDIYWDTKEAEYKICFYKTKGDKEIDNYPQDIQVLLKEIGFCCDQIHNKYFLLTDFDKVKENIESIIKRLKK